MWQAVSLSSVFNFTLLIMSEWRCCKGHSRRKGFLEFRHFIPAVDRKLFAKCTLFNNALFLEIYRLNWHTAHFTCFGGSRNFAKPNYEYDSNSTVYKQKHSIRKVSKIWLQIIGRIFTFLRNFVMGCFLGPDPRKRGPVVVCCKMYLLSVFCVVLKWNVF